MVERLMRAVVVPVAATVAAVLLAMLFLWLTGYPAVDTFRAIVRESLRDGYGFGQVLHTATLLTFTGLAVAIGFRGGFFNIGVEGQFTVGALALGVAAFHMQRMDAATLQGVPPVLMTVGLVLLAISASAVWAGIPGVLRAATGAHEVIVTIMMNFVALALANWAIRPHPDSFAVPAKQRTPAIPQSMRLPRLSEDWPVFSGSVVNWSLLLAVAAVVVVALVLYRTRLGFEVRAMGGNPHAARMAGIRPGRVTVLTMLLSGAVAGLASVDLVLGYKGYFEESLGLGMGFLGIAVALLAANEPVAIPFAALLFAVLNYGKVAAAGEVPKDIISIMEATLIFSLLAGNRVFAVLLDRARRKRAGRDDAGPDAPPQADADRRAGGTT